MAAQFNRALLSCLYESKNISDAILKFAVMANSSKSLALSERADVLLNYRDYIKKKDLVDRLRYATDGWVNAVRTNDEFKHIRYTVVGRRKSLLSLDDKITECQAHNQPISVNDILGIRIIVHNIAPEEYLDTDADGEDDESVFSKLAVFTFEFFKKFGFVPIPAEKLKSTDTFKKDEHQELFIPENPILPKEYRKYAKDYIHTPKENGYQTLQGVMLDPTTGKTFEWQIRTLSMHLRSDILSANHEKFKEERRANRNTDGNPDLAEEELDYSKIHMYGFIASGIPDQPYMDYAGLIDHQFFLQYQRINSLEAEF